MGQPAPILFRGLSPQAAAELLHSTSALEAIPSVAALGAGLENFPIEAEAILRVIELIDRIVEAVNERDLDEALRLKAELEEWIPEIDDKDWERTLSHLISGERMGPKRSRFETSPHPLELRTAAGGRDLRGSNRFASRAGRLLARSLDSLEELRRQAFEQREFGNQHEAAELFDQAARGYVQAQDLLKASENYYSAGEMLLGLGRLTEAIIAFIRARDLLSSATLVDPVTLRTAKELLEGSIQKAIAELPPTEDSTWEDWVIDLFEQVWVRLAATEERKLEAQSHYLLANLLLEKGLFPSAYDEALEAMDLFENRENWRGVGDSAAKLAEIASRQHERKTAAQVREIARFYDKAAHAYEKVEDLRAAGEMYRLKAQALYEGELFVFAVAAFGEMERTFNALKDKDQTRWARFFRLHALAMAGHADQALRAWETIARKEERLGNKGELASIYPHIAYFYRSQRRYDKEAESWLRAAQLALEMKGQQKAALYHGLASLAIAKSGERKGEAVVHWQKGVDILSATGERAAEGVLYLLVGRDYFNNGAYQKAIRMYLKAEEGLGLSGTAQLGQVYEYLGRAYHHLKQEQNAIDYLNRALRVYFGLQDQVGVARVDGFKSRIGATKN